MYRRTLLEADLDGVIGRDQFVREWDDLPCEGALMIIEEPRTLEMIWTRRRKGWWG